MAMLRPGGKAYKIAKTVMKQKGIKVPTPKEMAPTKPLTPYLQH
jgi:hypothetical protein